MVFYFKFKTRFNSSNSLRNYCCFRIRKTRVFRYLTDCIAFLYCSETAECSKLTLSALTSVPFMDLLSRKGLQVSSSPASKFVVEDFLFLDLRMEDIWKSRRQAWNLIPKNDLQCLQITYLKHRYIIQQSIFWEL